MNRQSFLLAAALAGLAAGLSLPAGAADEFPQRPITLVVPWPAGGNTDAVSRALALQLGNQLGKAVVVENRAGANGQIGAASVARAVPDGYTLLVASAETHSITSAAKRMPYDPQKDFQPIGSFAINPFMVVARATLPVRDIKSLVAYAQANPGKLNYGSWGAGSTGQIAMEMFKLQAGINMVHVPFNGTAPAETALLGGQIDLLVMPVGRAVAVNPTGKITVIAAMTSSRTPLMPEVATLREAGYDSLVAANWFGIVAPAKTPDSAVARLSSALDVALASGELQSAFRARGVDLIKQSPATFQRFIADEHARWSSTVANAKIDLN
jgi:tripartite-type tricarboxylate transporter receptor subunit TctC